MKAVLILLSVVGVAMARVRAPPIPNFPVDWTASEEDFLVQYQGEYDVVNGAYCCGKENCQVETQYQSGTDYFDCSHNRTRFDDPNNGDFVTLFAPTYKEMEVDPKTNKCVAYCPIDEDIFPYSVEVNSTYQGQKSINGKLYDDWQYKDVEFGTIVFETSDVYVDPKSQLPYEEIDVLTPFGIPLGLETTTFNTFTPGTPDPSHFAITGVDTCPEAQNCGSDMRQFVRRRWGMWKTWAKYYNINKQQKTDMLIQRLAKY